MPFCALQDGVTVPVHVPGVSAVYRIHASSGVHDDAGAQSASSQRVQWKWLLRASPAQLGALMQRVWSHDEVVQRLGSAESTLQQRDEALNRALAATAEQGAALQALGAESQARHAELQPLRAEVAAVQASLRDMAAQLQSQAEAAQQHLAHDHQRAHGDERVGQSGVAAEIGEAGDDMDMGVDQAGHQRAALEVDHSGLVRADAPADLADRSALDQDGDRRGALGRGAVDDAGVLDQGRGHELSPCD